MADRTFEFLLNQMERAASSDAPFSEGYPEKRDAVLRYAAALQEKIAGKDDLLVAYRLGGDHRRADRALARIEKANDELSALTVRTVAPTASS